ncbi:MAG: DNA polymerase III, subunit gamma and tau [Candidatus Pelagibacter sp.]|nr:DNA polymerase III, subunit gamma and tau [Candidatus Pelagibacter sp.]
MTNKILALKYRPQEFKDLIGQEAMAQTITNAIKLNKTPNAYLLTGIRGVGKTTTARLIAKALNCSNDFSKGEKCKTGEYCHCSEIINSNHMDILEMDAASKTGIDDVRELIENSKYSPTSAKYKIFIIDEAHMLSKQAFNGLLKTLEEPPPSLKFILATTEVKKIPVTILSRCQRFDLKRVSFEKLLEHLNKILQIEKGKISEEALKLIAKASEGSVRDAISLLDRALLTQNISEGGTVNEQEIRDMLGIADRGKLLSLFENVLVGEEKKVISGLNNLNEDGIDPKIFLNQILEILHLISRCKSLGNVDNDPNIQKHEVNIINDISGKMSFQDIGIFWQLTVKTLEDIKILSNELVALEMYLIQLMHVTDVDLNLNQTFEKKNLNFDLNNQLNKFKNNDSKNSSESKKQLKNTDQIQTDLNLEKERKADNSDPKVSSLNDLISLCAKENELELKFDLERNISLVSFSEGKIDVGFNENLNKNFIKNLTEKLLLWTGKRWIISLSKSKGEKTIYQKKKDKEKEEILNFKNDKIFKNISNHFPDVMVDNIEEDNNG